MPTIRSKPKSPDNVFTREFATSGSAVAVNENILAMIKPPL
jgi:hypothetical protein